MYKLIRSIFIFASVCISRSYSGTSADAKNDVLLFFFFIIPPLRNYWGRGAGLFSLYSEISLAYSILLDLILVRITENVTMPLFPLYNEISNNDPTRTVPFSLQFPD